MILELANKKYLPKRKLNIGTLEIIPNTIVVIQIVLIMV